MYKSPYECMPLIHTYDCIEKFELILKHDETTETTTNVLTAINSYTHITVTTCRICNQQAF